MSPDWTEMRELFGGGFLSNTDAPTRGRLEHYIPGEGRECVQGVLSRAIRTQRSFDLEHRVVREDETVSSIQSRVIPILDGDGQVAGRFGTTDDVTRHHRAQNALRESEKRLRVLVEGVPQLIWRADSGGHWT